MAFAPYQEPSRCTGTSTPGARALMYVLEEKFSRHTNMGIYNCRPVRGGTSLSVHGEGRAGDSGLPPASTSTYGDNVRRLLVQNAGPLGLQALIYNRRFYSRAYPTGRYYDGVNPHSDHIHWELGWYGARNLTVARARLILGGGQPATSAPSTDGGPIGAFPLASGYYGVDGRDGSVYGDRLAIRAIQREVGTTDDGRFGSITRSKVIAWQKKYALTADGKVGPLTWTKMRSV